MNLGTQHQPHSVCPCAPSLRAVGVAKGRPPGGGCCLPLRGASEFRRSASPGFPSSGWAVGVRYARAVGAGVRMWEPRTKLSPWLACPVVGCVPRGCCRAPSPGGGVAFPLCEGRLASGAVPPLAARPLGQAAGVPRSLGPGCGWCGRGDPARVPQRAPLRAVVARCGGGGKASPGGVSFAVVRGLWVQGLPLPRLPALWVGWRGPLPPCRCVPLARAGRPGATVRASG